LNQYHCRIPFIAIPLNKWVNFSIDVLSFVSECFKTQTFRSIDFISLSASCKIKRIFTMRGELPTRENINFESADLCPKIALLQGVEYENVNMGYESLIKSLYFLNNKNIAVLVNNANPGSLKYEIYPSNKIAQIKPENEEIQSKIF
jgi:Protein of unknown function (DUF667)